jgi:hypothetical protein
MCLKTVTALERPRIWSSRLVQGDQAVILLNAVNASLAMNVSREESSFRDGAGGAAP